MISFKPSPARRRGNPNWGKPFDLLAVTPSSFETLVQSLKLAPDQYETSKALKEWAFKNKDKKYVPLDLLELWGFVVAGEV